MGKNFVAFIVMFGIFVVAICVWVSSMKNEPMHMPGSVDTVIPSPAAETPAPAAVPADTATPASTAAPATPAAQP